MTITRLKVCKPKILKIHLLLHLADNMLEFQLDQLPHSTQSGDEIIDHAIYMHAG